MIPNLRRSNEHSPTRREDFEPKDSSNPVSLAVFSSTLITQSKYFKLTFRPGNFRLSQSNLTTKVRFSKFDGLLVVILTLERIQSTRVVFHTGPLKDHSEFDLGLKLS